jgi:uracil-DNA glycosylase family 4
METPFPQHAAPGRISGLAEPDADCALCPRLSEFRARQRAEHGDWHNGPVPSFGPLTAQLLIVGLAPGLQGANRTGRPFTGDYAGDLLYPTLLKYGFASGAYGRSINDGLKLENCRITNAVRCVPPQNKPVGAEIAACRPFLAAEIAAMKQLRTIVALGRIAHENVLRACGLRLKDHAFAHGARHALRPGLALADSYHCSRYNTNTGRLTEAMFEQVFDGVRDGLAGAG